MQKRGWMARLPPFGLAVLLMLPIVAAQSPFSSIGSLVQRSFGPILNLPLSGVSFIFWAKVLLWILIFALLFSVTAIIPNIKEKKNIRMVVAGILAFISVIPFTEALMRALFKTYGIVIATVLIFAPIFGIFFISGALTGKLKQMKRDRLAHGVMAVLYYILAVVIQNIVGGLTAGAFISDPSLGDVGNLAVGACGLLFLYHVFMMLLGGEEDTPHQQISSGLGNVWDWLKDKATPEHPTAPTPYPEQLVTAIRQLCGEINRFHDHWIMHGQGYRHIGNLLLEVEQNIFRNGDLRWLPYLADRRRGWNDAEANVLGMYVTLRDGINGLLRRPEFQQLRREHHREFQRCMSRWTRASLHYLQYNRRFRINRARLAGPVL